MSDSLEMPVHADELENLLKKKMDAFDLPASYRKQLRDWYVPLALELLHRLKIKPVKRPLVIGLQGAQGTGKSTLAQFIKLVIENTSAYKVGIMSLDDFYLSKAARIEMANKEHALFRSRGVPGTHDMKMLNAVLDAFLMRQACIKMPRFLKYKDDVGSIELVSGDVDLLLFEGWCVGLPAQNDAQLEVPVNDLEQMDDSTGYWRRYVNRRLATDYAALFARIDDCIFLKAQDFASVYEWRHLQEDKMLQNLYKLDESEAHLAVAMSARQLQRFMAHYERLTKHAMQVMPSYAMQTIELDQLHEVVEIKNKSGLVHLNCR